MPQAQIELRQPYILATCFQLTVVIYLTCRMASTFYPVEFKLLFLLRKYMLFRI